MEIEKWVVKSNALVEHKGKMTALEQKIIAVLASEISAEDEDFKDYEFSIKDFIELTGTNEKTMYNQIHESAQKLMKKIITIREGKSTVSVPMLGYVKTVEGEGRVIMRFDKSLKSEFLGLQKLFTQYQLVNVLNLKGGHSIRIYELLKQYQKLKSRSFKIAELKDLLGVANEYDRFYDFEKYVLQPAKSEINEKSDLWITYRKVKKGRAIDTIVFEIEPKYETVDVEAEDMKLYKGEDQYDYSSLKNLCGLAATRINEKQMMELYEIAISKTSNTQYKLDAKEYIRLNYEYSKDKAKNGLLAYLRKALKDDYANARIKLLGL